MSLERDEARLITWRKSSQSMEDKADCVEAARLDPHVGVRDSKDPAGTRLRFRPREWPVFVQRVKAGPHP